MLKVGATAVVTASSVAGGSVVVDDGTGSFLSTNTLLSDYHSQSALPTPLRTPRLNNGAGGDTILCEARNQLLTMSSQTPLLGGENPDLDLRDGTGLSGAAPQRLRAMSPRVAARSGRETPGGGASPKDEEGNFGGAWHAVRGDQSVDAIPLHDPLGVNNHFQSEALAGGLPVSSFRSSSISGMVSDDYSLDTSDTESLASTLDGNRGDGGQQQQLKHHLQAQQLANSLSNLPEPQYTYDIEVPSVAKPTENFNFDIDDSTNRDAMLEDAADEDAHLTTQKKAAEEAELARRSAAVRRGLPRPMNPEAILERLSPIKDGTAAAGIRSKTRGESSLPFFTERANTLVWSEMGDLLADDASKYPFSRPNDKSARKASAATSTILKKKRPGAAWSFEEIADDELAAARFAVAVESAGDAQARATGAIVVQDSNVDDVYGRQGDGRVGSAFIALLVVTQEGFAYLPERGGYGLLSTASAKERLSSLHYQFNSLRDHVSTHAQRCAKVGEWSARFVVYDGRDDRTDGLMDGYACKVIRKHTTIIVDAFS